MEVMNSLRSGMKRIFPKATPIGMFSTVNVEIGDEGIVLKSRAAGTEH